MKEKRNFIDKILQNRVLTHTLFWLFVLVIAPVTSNNLENIWDALLYRAVSMPLKIIATYWLAYYLIPKFLQKKKYLQFIVLFSLGTIVLTIVYRYNNIHIAERLANSPHPKESLGQIIYELEYTVFGYFLRLYVFSFLFIFLKMVKDRSHEKNQIETLEKEKATAELNFLKAQIHPHFLFNTLNNLYALTLDKSDEAPEVVAKLSEILDYMLYQCTDQKNPIHKEIAHLKNYIALEKLRYGKRLQLEFTHSVDESQTLIAPLLLIAIVENAFKHGVSGAIREAIVRISLEVRNKQLAFKVFNTKPNMTQGDIMDYKKGIGIKNIKRQLELLYPNNHHWKVEEHDTSYEVYLKIIL